VHIEPPISDSGEVTKSIEHLCTTVLSFSATKTPIKRLKIDLQTIYELAIDLSTAIMPDDAMLIISPPRVMPGCALEFCDLIMKDVVETNCNESGSKREVGMLLFPGLFKLYLETRTVVVKCKVLCKDDLGRNLEMALT